MTQRDRLMKALAREPVDRPPAAVPTQNAIEDVMRASGHAWPEAQRNAREMAALAWACHEIAGIESVRVPFDINVEAEAMGCATRFGDDMVTPPMSTPVPKKDFSSLRSPDPRKDGRMPEVIDAVRRLREMASGEVPVIAACGTPFELLATSMDYEDITMAFIEDPDFITSQMERLTGIARAYAGELVAAGADVLMAVDGTSQGIGPKYFELYSYPYTKRMLDGVGVPSILHICGNPTAILHLMADTGASGLSIDRPVDVAEALKLTGGKVSLVGNIAPATLYEGPVAAIEAEVEEAIKKGIHVAAPGCGILPQTPLEHVKAYVDRVRAWQDRTA